MKRFFVMCTLAFAAGIWLASVPEYTVSLLLFCGGVLSLAAISLTTLIRDRLNPLPLLMLAFFIFGAIYMFFQEKANQAKTNGLQGELRTVTARVTSIPALEERKTTAYIKSIAIDGKETAIKMRLTSWDLETAVRYGDIIQFSANISDPMSAQNMGGFSYRDYMKSQDILLMASTSYVDVTGNLQDPFSLVDLAVNLRQHIIQTIKRYHTGDIAAVLIGVMVGDASGLSDGVSENFSVSGVYHIMAVSGMHVGIWLSIALLLLRGRRRRWYGILIGISFIVAFILLVGMRASVMRAGIMAIICLSSDFAGKENDPLTALAIAVTIMLAVNPYTLFDAGFQLSVMATLGILLFMSGLNERFKYIKPAWLRTVIMMTLSAQLFTIPITARLFGRVSLLGLTANLVIVPLMPVALAMGALIVLGALITDFVGFIFAYAAGLLVKMFIVVVGVAANLSFASMRTLAPGIPALIAYGLALFALYELLRAKGGVREFLFKSKGGAAAGLALVLALSSWLSWYVRNEPSLHFINVGQGDSALFEMRGVRVLIDGGGNEDADVGKHTVIPYLNYMGIPGLDAVVASHFHTDHAKGLIPVLEAIKTRRLILPGVETENELRTEILAIAARKNIEVIYLHKGEQVTLGELHIKALLPDGEGSSDPDDENENTLVFLLQYHNSSALFTADIDIAAEEELAAGGMLSNVNILKVAHHGSRFATCDELLEIVSPQAAVISVGRNNYGHPAPDVLARLSQRDINIFRTDIHGNVIFSFDKKGISDVRWRGEGSRWID